MKKNKLFLKELFVLALPIILSNMISASASLISMFFIAKINTSALAAGAIITSSYGLIMMIFVSIFYSISIIIGHSRSGGNNFNISDIFSSGIGLALILSVPVLLIFLCITPILEFFQQPHDASLLAGNYFKGLAYGIVPSLILVVYTQFFMGIQKTKLILHLTIIGVLINTVLSYCFIFGLGGLKPLHLYGAGLASSVTAFLQLVLISSYILLKKEFRNFQLFSKKLLCFSHVKLLLKIGAPISIQYSVELLAFSIITYLMGMISENALAAQQITLQVTMLVIMITMGFSQAGSILISHTSMNSKSNQKEICLSTLFTGAIVIGLISCSYWFFSEKLISLYVNTHNPIMHEIVMTSKYLLIIAAITQFFDAGRNIAAGLLRGYGDTKSSMRTSITSCWLIGLPLASMFAFIFNFGAIGLRLGMMLGVVCGCFQLIQKLIKYNKSEGTMIQYNIKMESI